MVNEIIISENFYFKLNLEMEYITTTLKQEQIVKSTLNLKGFGDTECYKIYIPENGTFISYNNN